MGDVGDLKAALCSMYGPNSDWVKMEEFPDPSKAPGIRHGEITTPPTIREN